MKYNRVNLHHLLWLPSCLEMKQQQTDLDAIWQVHLWRPMTHCVRWPRGEAETWGPALIQNMQLLPTYEKDDLWFTRWQHWSAILPLNKLLWSLFRLEYLEVSLPRPPTAWKKQQTTFITVIKAVILTLALAQGWTLQMGLWAVS